MEVSAALISFVFRRGASDLDAVTEINDIFALLALFDLWKVLLFCSRYLLWTVKGELGLNISHFEIINRVREGEKNQFKDCCR